jgi:hypothetical protein
MTRETTTKKTLTISAPNFCVAEFEIKGIAPLVIHRFSSKTKEEMKQKMETGKAASNKKNREAKDTDDLYLDSKYVSNEGWEGFHAAAIRGAMISACRLVGFKMTLAKLSLFILQDGWDKKEPQIPLVHIYGEPTKQEDIARTSTGQPYVCVRTAYYQWYSNLRIRWDADQFTIEDIYNLLNRVGGQVGICEGRPDSKMSAGMGWGLFEVSKGKMLST